MSNSVAIFKALGDNTRLNIINTLLETPMYVELLSLRLDLTPSTISFHLKKLEEIGLVESTKEQYYVLYSVNTDFLNSTLLSLVQQKKLETAEHEEREQNYRQSLIDSFFIDGKLTSIPVQYMKRFIILEHIASSFEDNKKYTEKEVNLILADFFDDFIKLRKTLLTEGQLYCYDRLYSKTNTKNNLCDNFDKVLENASITHVPLAVSDFFTNGERAIYEIPHSNCSFEYPGKSKKESTNRIIITNKGKAIFIKDCKSNPLAQNFISKYLYAIDKKGLSFSSDGDVYSCSIPKLKTLHQSTSVPVFLTDVEISIPKADFEALQNTLEEKLFTIEK